MPECSEYVLSPFTTLYQAFVCIGLVMAYLPHYLKIAEYGTSSISPWFILWTSIFSSTQFASFLANIHVKPPFHCVKNGTLRGFSAFSAAIGHIQASAQWVSAMVYLIFYVSYRSHATGADLDSSHLPPSVASHVLEIAVIVQAVICVGIGIGLLVWPEPDDEAPLSVFLLYMFITGYSSLMLAAASLIIAIYQYIPQIRTVIILQDPGTISIPSLILQVIFFLTMSVSQAARLGLKGDRPGLWYRWVNLYLHVGTAWIPYTISAVGQAVLLGVSIYYTKHRDEA